jgi:hypothetical protein
MLKLDDSCSSILASIWLIKISIQKNTIQNYRYFLTVFQGVWGSFSAWTLVAGSDIV